MSANARCITCPTTLPRGLMHIRSRSLKQVAICASCMEVNERIESIVRAVREGVQAEMEHREKVRA